MSLLLAQSGRAKPASRRPLPGEEWTWRGRHATAPFDPTRTQAIACCHESLIFAWKLVHCAKRGERHARPAILASMRRVAGCTQLRSIRVGGDIRFLKPAWLRPARRAHAAQIAPSFGQGAS